MMYLTNRMQCNTLSQQMWWFVYILKVKGSNFTNGAFVVNNDKLTKYSLM